MMTNMLNYLKYNYTHPSTPTLLHSPSTCPILLHPHTPPSCIHTPHPLAVEQSSPAEGSVSPSRYIEVILVKNQKGMSPTVRLFSVPQSVEKMKIFHWWNVFVMTKHSYVTTTQCNLTWHDQPSNMSQKHTCMLFRLGISDLLLVARTTHRHIHYHMLLAIPFV